MKHLPELSRSAHSIKKEQALAKAWLQEGWAYYSGVSRTIAGASQAEADQIAKVLEQITQPILAADTIFLSEFLQFEFFQ